MSAPIEYFNGYRLVETTVITKQVQRRTHKKRRINKKWLKMYGYKTILDDGKIIIFENNIFGTPKTIKKIIKQMKGGEG